MKLLLLCLFSIAVIATANEKSLDDILREGNNAFTAKMFAEVVKEKPNKSVVLSAFSVLTPLAQLALASVGESRDELLSSIGMPNDNVTMMVFSEVNNHLRSVKEVTFKTASKIYVAKNYELNRGFTELSHSVFGSEVANVDFTENEKAAEEVNCWVENQTNNRIKDLIDPTSLDGSTKALLVNAIYFKGLWEIPFDKASTRSKNFYVSKEKVIQVPTMSNKGYYKYIDSQELNAQINVKRMFNENEARLDNLLKAVNCKLYISDAKQKTFIEVNEEGSEAASANVFNSIGASLILEKPQQFIADRPFYFVVKAKSLSLFNGIYAGN